MGSGTGWTLVAIVTITAATLIAPSQQTVPKNCLSKKLDIVFAIDSSTNVTERNFMTIMDFLSGFLGQLHISQNYTQVSVLTYADYVSQLISLDTFQSVEQLRKNLKDATYCPGENNLEGVLTYIIDTILTVERGSRSYAQKIVVLIVGSQWKHSSETKLQADQLKAMKVQVIIVAIAVKISQTELLHITTDTKYTYEKSNYTAMSSLLTWLSTMICAPVPPVVNCNKELDIVFAVDSSRGISKTDFHAVIRFVSEFIRQLRRSSSLIQVSVFTYSTAVHNHITLKQSRVSAFVETAMGRIKYCPGHRDTAKALHHVHTDSLSTLNGARRESQKIVIVFTHGRSLNRSATENEANFIKKKATVIAVGLGTSFDEDELRGIATDRSHILKVRTFSTLTSNYANLRMMVCADFSGGTKTKTWTNRRVWNNIHHNSTTHHSSSHTSHTSHNMAFKKH